MYRINSDVDKPDFEYLKSKLEESMDKGIRVDAEGIKQFRDKLEAAFNAKIAQIAERYSISKPNSRNQIIDYFNMNGSDEVIDIAYDIKTKSWCTDKNVMLKLKEMGYTIGGDIIAYRSMKKYLDSIKSFIDASDKNGMVHPSISVNKTNRMSYTDPALLTIPKALLWHLIKARDNDFELYSIDIKNQEPTIMINWLGEEELKTVLQEVIEHKVRGLYEALFGRALKPLAMCYITVGKNLNSKELDPTEVSKDKSVAPTTYMPYRPFCEGTYINGKKVTLLQPCIASIENGDHEFELPREICVKLDGKTELVRVKWNEEKLNRDKDGNYEIEGEIDGAYAVCEGDARKEFKTSWNALNYSSSLEGIKNYCKHVDANRIYEYYKSFKKIAEYKKICSQMAYAGKNAGRTAFGSLVKAGALPPSKMKRTLMDIIIQGTGADVLAMLVKHFNEEIEKRGLSKDLNFYYSRHDEIIIEIRKEYVSKQGAKKVETLLKDILEHQIDDWTPFMVEVGPVEKGDIEKVLYSDLEEEGDITNLF